MKLLSNLKNQLLNFSKKTGVVPLNNILNLTKTEHIVNKMRQKQTFNPEILVF